MKKWIFLLFALFSGSVVWAQTQAIAHRGYWKTDGSAQNSLAALEKAHALNIYGSEFDVWLTADGIPVVFHDAKVRELVVEEVTYQQLMDTTLVNGEKISTLEQYLEAGKQLKDIRLVLEIKSHKRVVNEDRVVAKVVEMVNRFQLEDRVDYIAFSMNVCKELKKRVPNGTIVYLNGDVSPQDLKEIGLSGFDYHHKVLTDHPDWIQQAKSLGLSTNVWTVNDPEQMKWFIEKEVDFITTDNPIALIELLGE
ncbi:glycerophosphodiester phosphodiesterase family protein [Parabacteroides sp. PF5-9]|uniref:glycerophosphodiester phosphodiesterase n=1 Tax=Parabacteroides sp. PF5-9 TaxID=1742404 RepID=UPI002476B594|nr:glycerophosphodiester phosphodiesterase family protein [Parabacteroides sp. PF5-9]MDH6356421.1 glycerophosphoryl diester phosphodiesterase [Parabacteroides sp. PF5-9]